MKKVQCNLDLVTQNLVTNRDLFSDYFAEDNFLVHKNITGCFLPVQFSDTKLGIF